jgi:hypothetical protein
MGDIITSSVRGEQPSQLSSIMPLPGYNSCRRHKTVQVQHHLLLVDCYVQICNGTAVEHGSLLNCSGVYDGINCCKSVIITK